VINSEFLLSLVGQLKALPAASLLLFAVPLAILAWWKQVYPAGRLLSLLLLPTLPTLGVVFPQIVRVALALSVIAIPISIWMYKKGNLSAWSAIYVGLVSITSFLAVYFDPLTAMVIADFCVLAAAAYDLSTVARQRDFVVERSCQKSASLKKSHPVSLTISNTGTRNRQREV